MKKLDLTRKYKTYFSAKTKPEIIEAESAQFISITGKGDPSGSTFSEKIQALYSVAYPIKFACKQREKDFIVSKLECLWWFDEKKFKACSMYDAPTRIPRSEWEYRLLIRLPEYITEQEVGQGVKIALARKKSTLTNTIEFYRMTEGLSVQMLHRGPFSQEQETLKQMQEFIQRHGFVKNGLHHEIYLSDFNKTHPDKLKTILREPVK